MDHPSEYDWDEMQGLANELNDARPLTQEFPDDWMNNVKLVIDPSGSLAATKSVVLSSGENIYMLDIDHIGDNTYQISYKGEVIGGLKQPNTRITGGIDVSLINDDFGQFIVVHLSRLPSAMYLMKINPKSKYNPQKTEYLTIEEFND